MTPYTKDRPTEPGWYWFRVGDDSPRTVTRLAKAIVLVGRGLWCRFPMGTYAVGDMGGEFAGPIPEPPEPEGA